MTKTDIWIVFSLWFGLVATLCLLESAGAKIAQEQSLQTVALQQIAVNTTNIATNTKQPVKITISGVDQAVFDGLNDQGKPKGKSK